MKLILKSLKLSRKRLTGKLWGQYG